MKSRQLSYVLVALIALGVVALVARLVSTESGADLLGGLSLLTPESVDKVVIGDSRTEATLTRVDGQWLVGRYPAHPVKQDEMWQAAQEFDGAQLVAISPQSHAQMGVSQENGTLVQFWRGDQLLERFVVGDKIIARVGNVEHNPWTPSVQLCYLRHGDGNEVYGIFCPFPNRFDPEPTSWAEPIVAMPSDDVKIVRWTYPDREFYLHRSEPAAVLTDFEVGEVWSVVLGNTFEPALNEEVDKLLVEFQDLLPSALLNDEEEGGLDFSRPDVTVKIEPKEESDSEAVLLLFLDRGDGSYYVKDSAKPYAYLLSRGGAGKILKGADEIIYAAPPGTPEVRQIPTPGSEGG